MSEKVELTEQEKLIETQVAAAQEIKAHIIKAESVLELVTDSLENKIKTQNYDIANELNSLVTVYDQLDHAFGDAETIEEFLKQAQVVDEKNA